MRTLLQAMCGLMVISTFMSAETEAANLLPNGSFEIGLGRWTGHDNGRRNGVLIPENYDEITAKKTGLISTEDPKLGRQSFCFAWPGFIQSQYVKLDEKKKYTISMYAKSDSASESLVFSIESSYRSGEGHGDRVVSEGHSFTVGTKTNSKLIGRIKNG